MRKFKWLKNQNNKDYLRIRGQSPYQFVKNIYLAVRFNARSQCYHYFEFILVGNGKEGQINLQKGLKSGSTEGLSLVCKAQIQKI